MNLIEKFSCFVKAAATSVRGSSASDPEYVQEEVRDRSWEDFYRHRWQHDKIVRSTHGCNCTGSCSWQIFVKNGVVTWELQQTDYPHTRPGLPNHEPRGCPRGASYSWYLYNSGRVKHPMIRRQLLEAYRQAKQSFKDPVDAWENVVNDTEKRNSYTSKRGLGDLVRLPWDEALEIIAASNIYTIKKYGPDRIAGFSPIPAFSMVSYGAGTRYLSLIGGTILSFYDFYCDLPPSSPQIWGEQTDVPESSDWYNSTFLMLWGSNVPVTRTPDSPFYTQVRYRGTKVVVVSPDYNDAAKFSDIWLNPSQGTDSALGMALGHVILQEFYINKSTAYFDDYARRFTDLPYLVKIIPTKDGRFKSGSILRASDFADDLNIKKNPFWYPVQIDETSQNFVVPKGSVGARWANNGTWNTKIEDVRTDAPYWPALTILNKNCEVVDIEFPYFGGSKYANPFFETNGAMDTVTHKIPVRKIKTKEGDTYVATVFDVMCAHYGVSRKKIGSEALELQYKENRPYTPAWAETVTGIPMAKIISVARQFAQNAEQTKGRTMIIIGAGVNQWFHTDMTYRAAINCLVLCGCIGQSGGGWAHYVGQEKIRPMAGWAVYSFASDWNRPSRQMNATSYFYEHCDMWRYEKISLQSLLSPLGNTDRWKDHQFVDANVMAQRMGWTPLSPQIDVNPIDITRQARKAHKDPAEFLCQGLHDRSIELCCDNLDKPSNVPRNLFIWRSNLLGCSGKGMEYFMRHLLGTQSNVLGLDNKDSGYPLPLLEPWADEAPRGKLDLVVTMDFRMTTSSLHSDIVLPAATWYEKNDISSTDMHPFIHPFCQAVNPNWEARTDWDIFKELSRKISELAGNHLHEEEDLVLTPMMHDSPSEISQPLCSVDWKTLGQMPVPGVNFANVAVVKRDYHQIFDKFTSVGPLITEKGMGNKGVSWSGDLATEQLKKLNGTVLRNGVSKGQPVMETDIQAANTILYLSPESNGKVAIEAWKNLDHRTGLNNVALSIQDGDKLIDYFNIVQQPRKSLTAPTWSGLESEEVSYNPGYINVHYNVPWRTLCGRQQLYQDHPWILDFGEALPQYRTPIFDRDLEQIIKKYKIKEPVMAINVMTPHSKWTIHSTWSDNNLMLTLGRGGALIWISEKDANKCGIKDNDWIEIFNDNGVSVARAVVSQRMPIGGAYYYHNPERTVNMPLSRITGNRGGLHNSIARICPNPLHMIGGYAQISYSFNYYGCIGSNRDEICLIRPLDHVEWE